MPVNGLDQALPVGIQPALQADAEQAVDDDVAPQVLSMPGFELPAGPLIKLVEMFRRGGLLAEVALHQQLHLHALFECIQRDHEGIAAVVARTGKNG